jgi:hypothetical protein
MATKYAVASGVWSSTSVWSDSDGGGAGASVPADGDTIFISTAVNVQMDVDQSAFTGLATVTVRGGATPGMLYWKDGASGYLKIRTGNNIVGTNAGGNRGRLLMNSDGVWGNTGAVAYATKCVIEIATGATGFNGLNLDMAFHASHPTNKWVTTYASKFAFNAATAVNAATDVIDLGTTPPAAGTAVRVRPQAGAVLPVPLDERQIYFLRTVSGNTCKLATSNADGSIVDITAVGSGTVDLYTGTASGTSTLNCFEDVTSDNWVTTAGHNRVVLVSDLQGADQQRLTLTTINAGSLVVSANTDSAQAPGARIYLASRNCQLLYTGSGASQVFINTPTEASNFDCELGSTAGTGVTTFGFAFSGSTTGPTVSANCVFWGWGRSYSSRSNVAGVWTVGGLYIMGGNFVSTCDSLEFSGCIIAAHVGTGVSAARRMKFSNGTVIHGNGTFITNTFNVEMDGVVAYGNGSVFSTATIGGHLVDSLFFSNNTPLSASSMLYIRDCYFYGNTTNAISWCINTVMVGGAVGYDANGARLVNGTADFRFPGSSTGSTPMHMVCRGVQTTNPPTFSQRNASTTGGFSVRNRREGVFFEHYLQALDEHYAALPTCDVVKQDGIVRSGGADTALEATPLSQLSVLAPAIIMEWEEPAVAASSTTRGIYVRGSGWSTFPTNTELYLEAEYVANDGTFTSDFAVSTAVLVDNSAWVNLTMNFTPAAVTPVRYRVWLKRYEAGAKVYVDAEVQTS